LVLTTSPSGGDAILTPSPWERIGVRALLIKISNYNRKILLKNKIKAE